jgi:hypothetical protein
MCIICETEDHSTLVNIQELDCSYCNEIKEFPLSLTNLTSLTIGCCPLIQEIGPLRDSCSTLPVPSTLTNLQKLYIEFCPLIKEISSSLTNLTVLVCRCPLLEKIPSTLTNLIKLDCSESLIKKIPSTLNKLQYLSCNYCDKLNEIPSTLINIKTITCYDCPLLYYIGIKHKPIYYNFNNTPFAKYNWSTHQDRFKYKISLRKISDFMYKLYIRKQKQRVLALCLWRFNLSDVRDIILKKLIK